jgi:hypothetical protein
LHNAPERGNACHLIKSNGWLPARDGALELLGLSGPEFAGWVNAKSEQQIKAKPRAIFRVGSQWRVFMLFMANQSSERAAGRIGRPAAC